MFDHEKINYLEFPAKDIELAKSFFSAAFGWSFVDYGPEYVAFEGQGVAGGGGFFQSDLVATIGTGSVLVVFIVMT